MEYADLIIGAACTIVGVLLSYAAFARNSKKDSEASGRESGTVLTEIGYIKGGVDRIERKQDERYLKMAERVTAVESSAKQAHKRIDRLEGHENRQFGEGAHHE